MSITLKTPIESIIRYLDECKKIVEEETIRTLSYLGEQCERRIKDRSASESWIDHTSNLRSSIGYAIYDYGTECIRSTFQSMLGASEGPKEGRKALDELAKRYSDTYALVVVAGMSYAEYVEAIEGKDVLASTELWAKDVLDKYMKLTSQRAEKRIKQIMI